MVSGESYTFRSWKKWLPAENRMSFMHAHRDSYRCKARWETRNSIRRRCLLRYNIGFCSHFISLDVDISLSYTLCEHTIILEINIVRIEYMEKYLRDPSTNICTVQSMCQGPFAHDDNDVNFLCRQKWVVWLRMAPVHT